MNKQRMLNISKGTDSLNSLDQTSIKRTPSLEKVSTLSPCRHCGKSDWCYTIGDLDVCKRQATPASGWEQTGKTDKEGTPYYAPVQQKKAARPKQTRHWEYLVYDGSFQLSKKIRVVRIDNGDGSKRIWQEHWNGKKWVKGLGGIKLQDVAPYRYLEVLEAIKRGEPIFFVEGEPVADLLWDLGIAATTNIGGSGKPFPTGLLSEAKVIVLAPDRDVPGVRHMLKVSTALGNKDVRWCLAFPDSVLWNRLPESGGLDLLDWVEQEGVTAQDILNASMDRSEFAEKLQQQLAAIIELKESRENSDGKGQKTDKLPPASEIAEELAEMYRTKLAWESEYQLWRHYGAKYDGVWSEETPESVRALIHAYLRSLPNSPGFTAGYVSSILTILQSDLEAKDWNEQKGLIPLRDGVLDQVTLKLEPHSPGYRFTWQLPFKWADSGVGCQPVEDFLLKITGHADIAEVLLCFLSAVVTRRSDLQRYLELIGGGGTGKSTFMALATALAGEENSVASKLGLLEKNQFETAKFYRKLLTLFPDSERWQGEVAVLKQMTGQDPIRYERKNVQQCKDYIYGGMVIISANEAPESSDRTSGLERRKLTVELDNRIPEYEGRNLIEELKPYLPGLLKRVLEIPRQRVTDLIKFTDRNVPALAQKKWSQMLETNVIAAWLNENAIISPDAKEYIGNDDPEMTGKRLYANYCKFTRESGHKGALPVKRFSTNLRDLLKNQLKVPIGEGRDRNGAYIQGVGLRCYYDPNGEIYPRPITKDRLCDGLEEKCDGSVMDETLTSAGCDECDGFLVNSENSKIEATVEVSKKTTEDVFVDAPAEPPKNPSHPSQPALASLPAPENPSPNPSQEVSDELIAGDLLPKSELLPESQPIRPSLDSYQPGQSVWGYFPHSEAKWLLATVESVENGMVRIQSGFLGMLVSNKELIAPGDWIMC